MPAMSRRDSEHGSHDPVVPTEAKRSGGTSFPRSCCLPTEKRSLDYARDDGGLMRKLAQFLPDTFTLAILADLVLAAFFPCRGETARLVGIGSQIAIALLFFLQGTRLSRQAVLAGILHWRLHLVILGTTFVVFPLIGLALQP